MKIFVGIPVCNRLEHLKTLSMSLKQIKGIEKCHIYLFDDASDEFDVDVLRDLFPMANVIRNETNLGADRNTFNIYKMFLEREEELLFLCDSDLILHPDCLEVIEDVFPETDGLLSLLNASAHPTIIKTNEQLVIKKSVGSAGLVLSRELVEALVASAEEKYTSMWDWYITVYMKQHKKRIIATEKSYVLHTGIDGENSNVLLFDYAMNYECATPFEERIYSQLNETFAQKYLSLGDFEKVKILSRKIFRETTRTLIARLFGEKRLLGLLVLRKQHFSTKGEKCSKQ